MNELLSHEAVMTALVAILVAIAGVLVAIIRAFGSRAVQAIEAWGDAGDEAAALTREERRRRTADEIVAAVEQMHGELTGPQKLTAALEMANEQEQWINREAIEAAVGRMNGTLSGWLGDARWEGTD